MCVCIYMFVLEFIGSGSVCGSTVSVRVRQIYVDLSKKQKM